MFTGQLLPYQREAVETMIAKKKILVAYDLGLGKTVISLAAIESLRAAGQIRKPTLVVALASLKYQWGSSVSKFTDSNSVVVDGTKTKRQAQIRSAVNWEYNDIQYVVMNYESVVNDWSFVADLDLDAIIIDEATAIKGFRSKRSKKIKDLARSVDVRYALTGTPVENGKPEEIFSILQAVDGKILGRFDHFDASYIVRNHWGGVQRYTNLDRLYARISSVLIRKTQTDPDVAPYLPDTIHRDPLIVPMERTVRGVYRTVADELTELLESAVQAYGTSWDVSAHYGVSQRKGPPDDVMGPIMSRLMLLRQLATFPELAVESADAFGARLKGDSARTLGSPVAYALVSEDGVRESLLSAKNKKMEALQALVRDHLDSDDEAKVVVFTSFRLSANRIAELLDGVVYSGDLDARQKEAAKISFQEDPDVRVLVSTDAGGYGVDLPQANLLVNFDLPWSAGTAVQRNGRIRRASSRWPTVVIQDLLTDGSIEIRQHDLLQQKNSVAGAVVDGQGIDTRGGVQLGAGSLLGFLRGRV
jgi:SNF2 family DNA or RNA helicase